MATLKNTTINDTGFFTMPVGTTAQRPSSGLANGMFRFNTTTGEPEWYSAATNAWVNFRDSPPYSAELFLWGGGGGGASGNNAGAAGRVVIRYLGSQRGSGGTVTSSGGYTIHTFTSSESHTG